MLAKKFCDEKAIETMFWALKPSEVSVFCERLVEFLRPNGVESDHETNRELSVLVCSFVNMFSFRQSNCVNKLSEQNTFFLRLEGFRLQILLDFLMFDLICSGKFLVL